MSEFIGTLIASILALIAMAFIDAALAQWIAGGIFPQFDYMEWFRIMLVATFPISTAIGISRMSSD